MRDWALRIVPFALVAACGLLYTAGDLAMKRWSSHPSVGPYVLGALMYIAGMNFLALSYRHRSMAVATALCVVVNIVTLTAVGWLWFREPLTARQMAGVALALTAACLLE